MRKLKTLKDVVRELEPDKVSNVFGADVKGCPYEYGYLKGHYNEKCEDTISCKACWSQPYIPFEDVNTDRERIIEALQTMKQICVEERNTKKRLDCNGCRLFDICSSIDDAFDGSEFFAWDIENLPEK